MKYAFRKESMQKNRALLDIHLCRKRSFQPFSEKIAGTGSLPFQKGLTSLDMCIRMAGFYSSANQTEEISAIRPVS